MFDLANEILQTLSHNKLRTALTGLAVAWGIFMLITLVSAANGVIDDFRTNMMNDDNQKIMVWGGVTTKPYAGYREGRNISLKNRDIDAIEQTHSKDVKAVVSQIYGTSSQVSTPTTYVQAGYQGVYPSALGLERLEMKQGRFINDDDMKKLAKVVVLPQTYAEQLFPPDGSKALGSRVTIQSLSFLVVGVYGDKWRRNIYIPYTTARSLTNDKDNVGQMTLVLKGVSTEDEATDIEDNLRGTMAATHEFSPQDESAVWIWNAVKQNLTVQGGMNILGLSVWILGLLTLLSGIIGISNIMFVSVKERTHEIGIRRAIGAKPRNILVQILTESIVITTLFGYIGIVLGTVLVAVIRSIGDEMTASMKVDLGLAFQVTMVLIASGALAGLFPALKALKVKPVEALRDE